MGTQTITPPPASCRRAQREAQREAEAAAAEAEARLDALVAAAPPFRAETLEQLALIFGAARS